MSKSQASPVKSALRTLEVIEFVVAHPGGVIARDIAGGLRIPLSSLSYLLATLTEREYLVREGRLYSAGPGLDRLRSNKKNLSLEDRVVPMVRALSAELDETASFMVREGWTARVVASQSSAQPLRYAIAKGETRPLHVLAGGKAILSSLPEEQFETYLDQTHNRREKLTEKSITSRIALRREIARCRDQGYATAIEESTPGICSIAFAVRILDTEGAFSIAVPSIRFTSGSQSDAQNALKRVVMAVESQ